MAPTSLAQHLDAFQAGRAIRVVNWHNTPRSRATKLRRELEGYTERFSPVSLDDLDEFFETGAWHRDRPGFIPVFYDGYRNNIDVAAAICDELGLLAWFFPPTGLLTTPEPDQRAFAAAHNITLLEEEGDQDRLAMTLDELAGIAGSHEVAHHTWGHAACAEIRDADDVRREITQPHRLLEEVTGRPPAAFAWRRGTSFDPNDRGSAELLRLGYRYVFSNTKLERIQ